MPSFVRIANNRIPAFKQKVLDVVSAKMGQAGAAVVAAAREYAPVDTGQLRDSIGFTYNASTMTLQIHVDVFYGIFQEFGTRSTPAHPFMRPALSEIGPIFGSVINTDIQFQAPQKYNYSAHTSAGRRGVSVRKFNPKTGHPLR